MYLFIMYIINDLGKQHFINWPSNVPLCVHAESSKCAAAILMAGIHNRPVHICHVSLREEVTSLLYMHILLF